MKRDKKQDINLQELEELRKKMIAIALKYGISHPKVLWYSQQIDEKHNCILKQKCEC